MTFSTGTTALGEHAVIKWPLATRNEAGGYLFCVQHCAGEAVQDKTFHAVRPRQTVFHRLFYQRYHDLVADERPGVHGGLGGEAERGARCDSCPQDIPGGQLADAILLRNFR